MFHAQGISYYSTAVGSTCWHLYVNVERHLFPGRNRQRDGRLSTEMPTRRP